MNELIQLENGEYSIVQSVIDTIVTIEKELEKTKEIQENYKKRLLELMEENNVLKIDVPELTITRRLSTTRESLDTRALRKDMPDVYDEYVKISDVKGSITIKVK